MAIWLYGLTATCQPPPPPAHTLILVIRSMAKVVKCICSTLEGRSLTRLFTAFRFLISPSASLARAGHFSPILLPARQTLLPPFSARHSRCAPPSGTVG